MLLGHPRLRFDLILRCIRRLHYPHPPWSMKSYTFCHWLSLLGSTHDSIFTTVSPFTCMLYIATLKPTIFPSPSAGELLHPEIRYRYVSRLLHTTSIHHLHLSCIAVILAYAIGIPPSFSAEYTKSTHNSVSANHCGNTDNVFNGQPPTHRVTVGQPMEPFHSVGHSKK